MALDGGLVAARDRAGERPRTALGPVRGGPQDERREELAGVVEADPLEQLARRLLEGDEEVRGDRGGGVVGGAVRLRDGERPHTKRRGQRLRQRRRRLR